MRHRFALDTQTWQTSLVIELRWKETGVHTYAGTRVGTLHDSHLERYTARS